MKKTGLSRPMTLDVLLPPFTESFDIVPSDAVSQWHYDQDGSYLPDRAVTPLVLTPTLSVFDPETHRTYTPSFYRVRWFVLNTTTGEYDIEITNTTDGNVDYVILPSGALKVKKNVPETAPVSLLCQLQYIDPRNVANVYTTNAKQQLSTNRDTSVASPTLSVNCESTVKYNPFIDGYTKDSYGVFHHNIAITGTARLGDTVLDVASAGSPYRIRWYAVGDGETQEKLIDDSTTAGGVAIATFPCYVSGQGTALLTLDAMMTDSITVIGRIFNTETNTLYPDRCLVHLTWDSIKVDPTTEAIDGGAVKQGTVSKTFRNIVTIRNRTLDATVVNENFMQEFKFRNAASSSVESLGFGPTVTVPASKLKAQESSLVYSELSLLESQKVVTLGDAVIVQDGRVVVCRY